jgi:hypothetical protein
MTSRYLRGSISTGYPAFHHSTLSSSCSSAASTGMTMVIGAGGEDPRSRRAPDETRRP